MKKILITGGSDGLGKAIAEELSKDNKVIIVSTNKEKCEQTAKELKCEYFVCDVSKFEQVENMIKNAGDIDVLINNAGLWIQEELDFNDFNKSRPPYNEKSKKREYNKYQLTSRNKLQKRKSSL